MRWTAEPGSALAKARMAAHHAFDIHWKWGGLTRSEAYARLAVKMNMSAAQCHIGMFDEVQCRQVVAICDAGGLCDLPVEQSGPA